ncbi:MAG: YfiR/HmsC family protein [Candidatus Aminicenantales bacterium]
MKRSLFAVLLLIASLRAFAQDMPVPVGLQAQIFIKVLLFDRTYERRTEDGLVVAVLYQEEFRRSFLAKEEFAAAAADWVDQSSGDVSFRSVFIDVDRAGALSESLAAAGADILYVAPLRSFDVGLIARTACDMRLPAYTGVPEYLSSGLAVSLDLQDNKPRILINLKAAKEMGAEFSSQILILARIIGGAEGSQR